MSFPVVHGYSLSKVLGKGAFGKVFLATSDATHQTVAVKQVKKNKVNDMQTLKEIMNMRKLIQHENVIKLCDVKEDAQHYYMVMELAPNGELFDYIGAGLREDVALFYFRQLAAAMEYMHGNNVCHRDLKLENILLDPQYNMKVCDFGFSRLLSTSEGPSVMYTMCGSPAYVAPEILAGQGYDGRVADIWSCGVILCAMLTACLPVEDRAWDGDPFFDKLKRHQYDYEPWGQQLRGPAEDLCKHMLEADPARRWTWAQIKQHPWFQGATVRPAVHMELGAYMLAQKTGAIPEPVAAPSVVVYRSHDADLGETGAYDEAVDREGLDVDALLRKQAIEASVQMLPFCEGDLTATTFSLLPKLPVPDLVGALQQKLTEQQWLCRVEEDGVTLKCKRVTPRGKMSMRVSLLRNEQGVVLGSCMRLKGDQFLFKRQFDALAATVGSLC